MSQMSNEARAASATILIFTFVGIGVGFNVFFGGIGILGDDLAIAVFASEIIIFSIFFVGTLIAATAGIGVGMSMNEPDAAAIATGVGSFVGYIVMIFSIITFVSMGLPAHSDNAANGANFGLLGWIVLLMMGMIPAFVGAFVAAIVNWMNKEI